MYPWWEIPRIDDFCTGSFKKVFTIDYKNGFSRRGKCCLTQRETVTSSHVREKTKKCQNCERLSRNTGFTHRKWGSLPVAKIKQRLHYCPVGLQLFYCAPILGQETLRNKILDRLSWQKNRLGKIQSTMKRKTSSWEILSGVPSNLWKIHYENIDDLFFSIRDSVTTNPSCIWRTWRLEISVGDSVFGSLSFSWILAGGFLWTRVVCVFQSFKRRTVNLQRETNVTSCVRNKKKTSPAVSAVRRIVRKLPSFKTGQWSVNLFRNVKRTGKLFSKWNTSFSRRRLTLGPKEHQCYVIDSFAHFGSCA